MRKCDLDAKRRHDREYQRIRRQTNPEAVRRVRLKYQLSHPYRKVDPVIKRANQSLAAKNRWKNPIRREKIAQSQRSAQLKKDLTLLASVIKSLRGRLEFPEKNRTRAREFHRKHADRLNAQRRAKQRPHLLPQRLHAAILRINRRNEKARSGRPAALAKAFRKVLTRATRAVEQKIRKRLCSRWERASKSKAHSAVIIRLSGTSLAGVRMHLESKFAPGMTWKNHGYGPGFWNIDHIRPLASFKLSEPAQALAAFHYSNLQPLWHEINMAKRDK